MPEVSKTSLIGVIVQAGAVGLAALSIYCLYNFATTYVSEGTKVWRENTAVMTELKEAINSNTDVTDRLERSLELNAGRNTTLKIAE
jgi:hypothetical protein